MEILLDTKQLVIHLVIFLMIIKSINILLVELKKPPSNLNIGEDIKRINYIFKD